MADQYHIDSNIVTTSDSIEPMAGLVVNTTMTDNQSVISNVTTGGVGAKGDKGEQGIPGATGTTGPKGDKGADSTVPGPQGPQGPQGVQGTAGSNGTNGAKGDKGDTGATGLKGDKGDTGLTGAAGTNGQGVPTGGTTGQQLAKINGTDYNTQWVNPVDISGKADTTTLTAHTSNTSNPHSVTKAQVGLGSVPNTDFTSAIAVKQDTLVSGTSIKTVNSTSLLGSGDIVIGGAVDSVNTQTGAVVLDTDDIAEGTNKYVTSAEKTILSNTSGVNTGDQVVPAQFNPIAGSNVTLTGTYPNVTFNSSGGGTWGSITGTLSSQTDLNSALGGKFDKTGGTITQTGSNSGYVDIRSGPTGNRSSFSLTGNGSPNVGDTMTFQMRNDIGDAIAFVYDLSASTYHNFLRFDYLNDKVSFPHMLPFSNLTYGLGSSSAYFANTYTQKLYLNSTAYLDGSTAGQVNITGAVSASNLSGNNTGDQDISGKADVSALTAHTSNTSNPHLVTKSQVGLSNVPNTDFTSAVSANTAKISYTDGTAVAANTSARHTHANKSLLDTYTQTEANLADAVAKRHTPVDISGKQDTLVSGTNIKTINSTSLLGSGDIVVAAGSDPLKEDVANKDTTTTLGTSDTLYPSQKAVKTYVDTTAGAYVPLAGGTMSGALTVSASDLYLLDGNLKIGNYSVNTGDGLIELTGGTGGNTNKGLQIKNGASAAFRLLPSTNSIYLQNTGTGDILLTGLNNATLGGSIVLKTDTAVRPDSNGVTSLGLATKYWGNLYASRHYLNSTAYLDGSVAGIVNISGGIKVTNSSTFSSPITVNSLSTGTAIDIRTPLNAFGESIYMTIQTRARIGYDGTGLVLDDNNTNKRVRISSNSRSWDFSTAGSFVAPGDMEITDTTKGVILKAPGGGRWRLTIDNSGNIVTTSI